MEAYIILETPKSIYSKRTEKEITSLIKQGFKTYEIKLKMKFVGSPKLTKSITNKFQVLKNKIAFAQRN